MNTENRQSDERSANDVVIIISAGRCNTIVSLAYLSFASQLSTSTCKANMFASTSTAASASVQCACRCQCRRAAASKTVIRSASTYTHPVRPARGWKLPDFAQAKRSVDLPAPKVQLFENKVSAMLASCRDVQKADLSSSILEGLAAKRHPHHHVHSCS